MPMISTISSRVARSIGRSGVKVNLSQIIVRSSKKVLKNIFFYFSTVDDLINFSLHTIIGSIYTRIKSQSVYNPTCAGD